MKQSCFFIIKPFLYKGYPLFLKRIPYFFFDSLLWQYGQLPHEEQSPPQPPFPFAFFTIDEMITPSTIAEAPMMTKISGTPICVASFSFSFRRNAELSQDLSPGFPKPIVPDFENRIPFSGTRLDFYSSQALPAKLSLRV